MPQETVLPIIAVEEQVIVDVETTAPPPRVETPPPQSLAGGASEAQVEISAPQPSADTSPSSPDNGTSVEGEVGAQDAEIVPSSDREDAAQNLGNEVQQQAQQPSSPVDPLPVDDDIMLEHNEQSARTSPVRPAAALPAVAASPQRKRARSTDGEDSGNEGDVDENIGEATPRAPRHLPKRARRELVPSKIKAAAAPPALAQAPAAPSVSEHTTPAVQVQQPQPAAPQTEASPPAPAPTRQPRFSFPATPTTQAFQQLQPQGSKGRRDSSTRAAVPRVNQARGRYFAKHQQRRKHSKSCLLLCRTYPSLPPSLLPQLPAPAPLQPQPRKLEMI